MTAATDHRPQHPLTAAERARLNFAYEGIAEKAGLHAARAKLRSAVGEIFEEAQNAKRAADYAVADAKAAYDDVLAVAAWQLGGSFVVHANKNYLQVDTDHERSLTADEKAAWIAREAAKLDEVRDAASELRRLTMAADEARDKVLLAERRLQAARYDLEGSIALVNLLTAGLHTAQPKEA